MHIASMSKGEGRTHGTKLNLITFQIILLETTHANIFKFFRFPIKNYMQHDYLKNKYYFIF